MAKVLRPLFSLGAIGAFGKDLIARRRGHSHAIERKPMPKDARTVSQLSWRTMYQKAVALWHLLSAPEKQLWERQATPLHMTGFAYFMSQALRPNPGIYLPLAGGTMQGAIDMDSKRITDLPAPGAANDPTRLAELAAHEAAATGVHGAGANTLLNSGDGQLLVKIAPMRVYLGLNVSEGPRTATINAVAGDIITLTANHAYRFFNTQMCDNSYLKIANTSKDPVEYAWVKDIPANDELQVVTAADIAGWANAETISTAEDGAASEYAELDLGLTVPDGAVGVFGTLVTRDTGIMAGWKGSYLKKDHDSALTKSALAQVSTFALKVFPFVEITTDRHILVRDRATGVDTMQTTVDIQAYIR